MHFSSLICRKLRQLWYFFAYTWSDSDVILRTPPCWRYKTVTSVLRHIHTYAPKLLWKLNTVLNASAANNCDTWNVRFPHFIRRLFK